MEVYKQKVRLSSFFCTENVIKNYFNNFPEKSFKKITIEDLNKWFNSFSCSRKRKLRIYGVLKNIFEYLEIYHGIHNLEYKKIIIPKEEYYELEEKYILSLKDFKLLVSGMKKDSIFYVLFMFAFVCGLRISEVLGIKVKDIDLNKGVFKLRHQFNDTIRGNPEVKYTQLKSKNSLRDYVLPKSFVKILDEYIKKQNLNEENFLFKYKSKVVPCARSVVNKVLHNQQKKKGLPLFSFHAFRRSEASLLNDIGVSGDVIASYLGHNSYEITKQYYIGNSLEKKQKIAKILEKKIFSI